MTPPPGQTGQEFVTHRSADKKKPLTQLNLQMLYVELDYQHKILYPLDGIKMLYDLKLWTAENMNCFTHLAVYNIIRPVAVYDSTTYGVGVGAGWGVSTLVQL